MMLFFRWLLILVGMSFFSQSYAGVVLNGTRVIYNEGQREVQVRMNNTDEKPFLLQNWIDDGQTDALPADIQVPFTLSPPITRIEANGGQVLRIFYTGEALPSDVESVFWLNVLAAPSKNKSLEGENQLQIAFRTRIKLFYRPKSLKGMTLTKAFKEVSVSSSGNAVKINNKTPFHISIAKVSITVGDKVYKTEGEMVSPRDHDTFRFSELSQIPTGAKLNISYINDYGGTSIIERTIE